MSNTLGNISRFFFSFSVGGTLRTWSLEDLVETTAEKLVQLDKLHGQSVICGHVWSADTSARRRVLRRLLHIGVGAGEI